MNGQQAYKILTNIELKNPCVCRYGKRLSQIWVSRSYDYGSACYEAIITKRDNDPQTAESLQLWQSELEDYLCQWDDDEWCATMATLHDMAAKGIDV